VARGQLLACQPAGRDPERLQQEEEEEGQWDGGWKRTAAQPLHGPKGIVPARHRVGPGRPCCPRPQPCLKIIVVPEVFTIRCSCLLRVERRWRH